MASMDYLNDSNENWLKFGSIGEFVQQLSKYFDARTHLDDQILCKLALYERLIEKTGPTNVDPINRHLSEFEKWSINNMNACIHQNPEELNPEYSNILYNENVYLPLNALILRIDDENVMKLMWKHILNISYKLTKKAEFKNCLLKMYTKKKSNKGKGNKSNKGCKEEELINSTMAQIKSELSHMKDVNSPKEVLTEMAKNGSFGKLLDTFTSGMEQGDIDMSKMFSIVLSKVGVCNENADMSGLGSMMKLIGGGNSSNNEEESKMFEDLEKYTR